MTVGTAEPLAIAHVMVTDNFAGVERYVTQTATELARRGHQPVVIGGSPALVPSALPASVRWHRGETVRRALAGLSRERPLDVIHVHMTNAELAGLLATSRSRAVLVSTRHFAAKRGSTLWGRAFSPLFNRRVNCQIAISRFVAANLETEPALVLRPGTPVRDNHYLPSSRRVVMVQRLEPEKDTLLGLRTWALSGLRKEGWTLEVYGDGSQREILEGWTRAQAMGDSVRFCGWTSDVSNVFDSAALLLAPAPAEPFGLSVVEAMASGVPVVAAAGGGHLETIGEVDMPSFRPGAVSEAAAALRTLAHDQSLRTHLGQRARAHQQEHLTVHRHVDQLEKVYGSLTAVGHRP